MCTNPISESCVNLSLSMTRKTTCSTYSRGSDTSLIVTAFTSRHEGASDW